MDIINIDDLSPDKINSEFCRSLLKDIKNINLCFEFKSDFTNTKNIRDCVLNILDILWVSPIWQRRFVLIVDELNNNAIEYWSDKGSINHMYLKIKRYDDWININLEVEDNWNWKCSKTAREMEDLRNKKVSMWFDNHKSIRWRGLFMIITNLVDELYFKDSNKWWLIVWINKIISLKSK